MVNRFEETKKLAEQGNAEAQFRLSVMYEQGEETEKDEAEAYEWCEKAAEQGYPGAILKMGNRYYDADMTAHISNGEAAKWFEKAAEAENPEAMDKLGLLYFWGSGVEKNNNKAMELFLKASELGYGEAMYDLGTMYANGDGVEKNLEKAFEWYKKSAENHSTYGTLELGICYMWGDGCEKNTEKALKYLSAAAELGDSYVKGRAKFKLGYIYEQGMDVDKDTKKAFELYKEAAELGYANAQYIMGTEYCDGENPDADKALANLYRAAVQGCGAAQAELGHHFIKGDIVPQNYKVAFDFYEQAMQHGETIAKRELAWAYLVGAEKAGIESDEKKAVRLFKESADEGDNFSKLMYATFFKEDDIFAKCIDKSDEKALELYIKAGEEGDPLGWYNAGRMYLEGKSIPHDREKANEMFKKAAALDDSFSDMVE